MSRRAPSTHHDHTPPDNDGPPVLDQQPTSNHDGTGDDQHQRQSSEEPQHQDGLDRSVSPVNNKRVQDLLNNRNGPTHEPQFDAFDSNNQFSGGFGPEHNQCDGGTPYCTEACNTTTPCNDQCPPSCKPRTDSRQFDCHNDKPNEYWTRDGRGDWCPRAKNSSQPSRRYPTYEGLMSDNEGVPNTSHGRYVSSLLNRMTTQERDKAQKKDRQLAFPDSGAETDTRSIRMNYSQQPRNQHKCQGAPPQHCHDDVPPQWQRERSEMAHRMRQMEQELARMRDKQYESDHYNNGHRYRRQTDDNYHDRRPYYEQRSEASRNIKFPRFKGKPDEYPAFKAAFKRCCKLLKYTDEEAQTQLLCCVEGGARNSLSHVGPTATVHDMLHLLDARFGYNLSLADVANKLAEMKRKSGESLHDLADRVLNTVRCADMPEDERTQKARDTFFHALRTNRELQHYVGRNDTHRPHNIELTLALAIQYELDHGKGTSEHRSNVRQVDDSVVSEGEEEEDLSTDKVNQLMFTNLSAIKEPTLKKIGKQQNEMVELFKKQQSLLEKHLNKPSSNSSRTSQRSTSSYRSSASSTSSNKPRPSFKPNGKKTGKPFFNKKKTTGKSFKPKTTVNEVDAQPEDDAEDGECQASGEDPDASGPEQSDQE